MNSSDYLLVASTYLENARLRCVRLTQPSTLSRLLLESVVGVVWKRAAMFWACSEAAELANAVAGSLPDVSAEIVERNESGVVACEGLELVKMASSSCIWRA